MELKEKRKSKKARLKERFGHEDFRPHQLEAIEALEQKNDVFLRKPTGGGKSLIYQFLALDHKVVVLSPLIALMDDQVRQARTFGVSARAMHSNQSSGERQSALSKWQKSSEGLLLVTPERFSKSNFKEVLSQSPPEYFVLDEAHCASQWGHDFRPDYSKVGEIKKFLGDPPTLACTATATPQTKKDIFESLNFTDQALALEDGVLRENLSFEVEETFDFKEKSEKLMEILSEAQGPTLIYFALIKNLEKVSEILNLPHVRYHSKISPQERRANQKSFIRGEVNLMLATPAFGLGVDKPDIRKLIHFELPGSIEAYVQEFGRAGRDGESATCFLLYSQEDIQVQMDFIKWGYPEPETLTWLHRQIKNHNDTGFPQANLDELKKKLNFYNSYDFRLESALNILLRWGCLVRKKNLIFLGPEDLENVPDVQNKMNDTLIKNQQMKLYDLLTLVKLPTEQDFNNRIRTYFGEV